MTPEERAARLDWLESRYTLTLEEPYGTRTQRWLPGACPHPDVRCVHGDEIIACGGRRAKCRQCGRYLRGVLPAVCWFTGGLHPTVPETGTGPDRKPAG